MPIILPPDLPVARSLSAEGRSVLFARRGDAVRIGLLNLMPDKTRTEAQFARRLGDAATPVELVLARFPSYRARHAAEHVERFYSDIDRALDDGLDALIVTGAPVELMEFEQVDYWRAFLAMMARAETRVPHRLFVCWAAQAALFARYSIPKVERASKAFGVFDLHIVTPGSSLLHGLGPSYKVPVSRHTQTRAADLERAPLRLLSGCPCTGPGVVESEDGAEVYSFNHFEYDRMALADEYNRDRRAGLPTAAPLHYFRDDDPNGRPDDRWSGKAQLFFDNWLARVVATARGRRTALCAPARISTPATTFGLTNPPQNAAIANAELGD